MQLLWRVGMLESDQVVDDHVYHTEQVAFIFCGACGIGALRTG